MTTNSSQPQCDDWSVSSVPNQDNIPYCSIVYDHNTTHRDIWASCCAPNPVQIYNGCLEWCEIPSSYFQGVDNTTLSNADSGIVTSLFMQCLTSGGRNASAAAAAAAAAASNDTAADNGTLWAYQTGCNFPASSNAAIRGATLPWQHRHHQDGLPIVPIVAVLTYFWMLVLR
ncbi:hypothetical protein VTN96DRAFT_5631 [Rasamsonia emersonii]